MTVVGSILLYHNGNSRVIQEFQERFRFHHFKGNWIDNLDCAQDHCLYEICIADANDYNLSRAREMGIKVYRYITSYQDDFDHPVLELKVPDYRSWLTHIVCKNLCFSDIIDSQSCNVTLEHATDDSTIIITTGRTANTHLCKSNPTVDMFEGNKTIDEKLFKAGQAILLWRVDQWECLTSIWIMNTTEALHQYNHQLTGTPRPTVDLSVQWIESDWKNLCQSVLDQALFFRYVFKRPICHMTTEDVIVRFRSSSQKINYDKSHLIPNYRKIKDYYTDSAVEKLLNMCYKNTLTHIV